MARRRRTVVSRFFSSASFSSVLVCFQERTSCVFSTFAQSCRRRFTEANSGVSWLASDADLLRARSVTQTASVGSSSELSNLHSKEESLVLATGNYGSSQIWARSPTTAILRPLLLSAAASPAWCFSRNVHHPHATGQVLGFQDLGHLWALLVMGLILGWSFLGLMDQQRVFVSPQPIASRSFSPYRIRLWSPFVGFFCLVSHLIDFQKVFSASSFNWWFGPMSISFHLKEKIQQNMVTANSPLLHWRYFAEYRFPFGTIELPRYQNSSCRGQREIVFPHCSSPRYQNSSCRGQREIVFPHCSSPRYQNSSCRGQREIVFPILLLEGENCSTILLVFMALVCCACVARSGLELEGVSSETLLSDIFKGSAKVAVSMIVISVLVAVSIANNRPLLVLFVSQGIVSLTSSKVVKVRRLHDIYGSSVKIACNYPFIFSCLCIQLAFEAAMVLLPSDVTNSSFYGE